MKARSIVKRELIKLFSLGKPKKKVLFDSFSGTQYSADPRAISEKLHSMFPEYEIVWFFKPESREKNATLIPDYIRIVDSKFGYIKELASSFAYVTTEPLTASFYKRKNQLVIQTWHGDRGMKKILIEAAESIGKTRDPILDNDYTDFCIAASKYGEDRYRNAFKYSGAILKVGMPRNDKLIFPDEQYNYELKKHFNVPNDCKILTYAPTFRGHAKIEQDSVIDIERTLAILEEKGEHWICFVRSHEYSKKINYTCSSNKVIDVSNYPDMADILSITDMLITDYSSCAGDFLVTKKPIVLVINDENEYAQSSRKLYFDLRNMGLVLSHSQAELENILKSYSAMDFRSASEKALQFYETYESGRAAEEVCRIINEHFLRININI